LKGFEDCYDVISYDVISYDVISYDVIIVGMPCTGAL